MTQAFIFDFDGTLVDSEQAIYTCFQSITKKIAPERIDYAKNVLIGPPLRETASEILGQKYQDSLDEFVELFIEMHDDQVLQHTKPYPGVVEVLKKLHSKNIPMALATNKRFKPTKKLIDHFNWNHYFLFIECSDSQSKKRSKDLMIKDIINTNNLFEGSYFVGDTVSDGISANLNQLKFIKANYGYGRKQDWKDVSVANEIEFFSQVKKLL